MIVSSAACAAEELSHIDLRSAAYCALYAREATRIDIMHTSPISSLTADTDYIVNMSRKIYNQCLSILPTLLPLPEPHRELDSWSADMRDFIILKSGVAPATDEPEGSYEAQCAAEYRTWDPDTKTVVRKGSPERVPRPCGKEVDCG